VIRVVLIELLLFLLPFALYAGFVYLRRTQEEDQGLWHDVPLFYLTMAGAALIAIGFISFATFTGAPTDAEYVPAIIKDGKIVPGQMRRPDDG